MIILGRLIDERFLAHRQRATSIAGQAGGVLAIGLFAWRLYVDNFWNWDLLAVAITVVVVKLTVMIWSGLKA